MLQYEQHKRYNALRGYSTKEQSGIMAKIMLVEDDNNLREIYEARLLAEGYEVISTKDGEEALAMATKEKPDLIISDVMMPKISGFDMLDILRSTPGIEHTKVVMMTALSQAEDKDRATKLGADRYLVKSQVTLEDVARVADELLNGDGGSTAPPAPPVDVTNDTGTSDDDNTSGDDAPSDASNQPANPPTPAPAATDQQPTNEPQQSETTDNATQDANNAPVAQPAATEPVAQPAPPVAATPPTPNNEPAPVVNEPATTETNESPAVEPPPPPSPTLPNVSTPDTSNPTPVTTDTEQPPTPIKSPAPDASTPTPVTTQAQTTAEEEAAIDEKIDDFVKNQLQSTEPAAPEQPAAPAPAPPPTDPNDQLNQGEGFSLPSNEPTQTIEVKQASGPAAATPVAQPAAPSPATTQPAPEPAASQQPAAPEPAASQPTPATPPAADAAAPNAATGGQRVIQPISDTSAPQQPDINQLAAAEEAKEQQSKPAEASGQNPPNPPQAGTDPNSIAL